jgi:hypothetical protein
LMKKPIGSSSITLLKRHSIGIASMITWFLRQFTEATYVEYQFKKGRIISKLFIYTKYFLTNRTRRSFSSHCRINEVNS